MTTLADPKDLLAEHTSALTAYAERVFGRHAPLTSVEEADRARRMREYFEIGGSFRLTESEIGKRCIHPLSIATPRGGNGYARGLSTRLVSR